MNSPFVQALELAWSDGGLSAEGANMLESVQALMGMSDSRRAEVEEPWNSNELQKLKRKGFGAGSTELGLWLKGLEQANSGGLDEEAVAAGRAALDAGLSKSAWKAANRWCTDLGCGSAFAEGVWKVSDVEASIPTSTYLKPLIQILNLKD